jgi:hypothetical protein
MPRFPLAQLLLVAFSACSSPGPEATPPDSPGGAGSEAPAPAASSAPDAGLAPPDSLGAGGVGGTQAVRCGQVGVDCPAGCQAVPVTRGCGALAELTTICADAATGIWGADCGVRASDGAVYRVHATYPFGPDYWGGNETAPSSFATVPGFRPCVQAEVDASDCLPPEGVSTQTVTVVVTNTGSTDLYLVVGGYSCTALELDRLRDGTQVVQSIYPPITCFSEWEYWPTTVTEILPAGESRTLTWDARELELVEQVVTCYQGQPTEGSVNAHELTGIARRSAPGLYRLTVRFDRTSCAYPDCFDKIMRPLTHDLPRTSGCPADAAISVDFTLPISGDVTVPISIE